MINSLVDFCSQNYSKIIPCPGCDNDCQGGCEDCLDAIHFDKISRRYNCKNIASFYACKYAYKYSSEIDRLFSSLKTWKTHPFLNILSIGCGPCTELIGIIRSVKKCQFGGKIDYVGFDINPIWVPIHEFYKQKSNVAVKGIGLRYFYQDVYKSGLFNS